jgi:putative membrane-bound dehydrogenase-like protein
MIHRLIPLLFLFPAAALAAEPALAPLPPEDAAREMRVPEGFSVSLVAAEPDVVQPISFCFDDRGRLFVAEALNYGAWQPTGKDRIVILEDSDGDGRFESRKVFYDELNYVTGVEVGFGGVWVMSPPKLYFLPDKDGDDKLDGEPVVLFDGFGHKESRHNLANGFTWGPDGWLYAGHGRTSPSDVGRPGTSDRERIHCDGGVYRIHPTRMDFENFADGTTNPWGVDFNDYGQCFVSNCVNPHLFHVLQGGHYEPWRNRPSSLYAYDRLPTCADHLHYPSGKPNAMRGETAETLALGGGHAHCGTLIYLGDSFPPLYRNSAFLCNVHGRRINHDILRPKGSGYVASHSSDLAIAADPWFMGVTLRTGPDGSVFVSDWSDTGECHTYKPNKETGRIYKISYGKPKRVPIDVAKLSDDELVELQLHKNDWYVRHARRLLQERSANSEWKGDAAHAALRETLERHEDVTRRLRALWALHVTGGLDARALLRLLDDPAEHVRGWAIQLLCEKDRPSPEALEKFAALAKGDPSPIVRLYLAAALQRLPLEDRWSIAVGLAGHVEDAGDANLPLMIWYGLEPLVPEAPEQFTKLAGAAKIPLVRQFLARRLVDHVVSLGEKGSLELLAAALAEASEAAQLDLLVGAREALRGQKRMKMPTGWPEVYARLKKHPAPAARDHATALALVFDDPAALADLRQLALSSEAAAAARQAALEALFDKQLPDLAPALHLLLADKAVRRTALRGLAILPHEETPRRVLACYADLTSDERQDAVATLASRKDFALAMLDAIDGKIVPRGDLSAYVARQLYALGDDRVTERLRSVWGDVRDALPQKQEQLAKYKSLLSPAFLKKADLAGGKKLYTKTCQNCHVLYGEGGKIGPDLTGTNRSNLDYLLSNLLDPGAEIGRDYRMSTVVTSSGRVITGMILERTPARLTIQTATEKMVLPARDAELIKDSAVSMMPDGQLDQLTKEQVRDLIGYLAAPLQIALPSESLPEKRPGGE